MRPYDARTKENVEALCEVVHGAADGLVSIHVVHNRVFVTNHVMGEQVSMSRDDFDALVSWYMADQSDQSDAMRVE